APFLPLCYFLIVLSRQAKPVLKDTGAYQSHQDLIIGDSRSLVHSVQAIQKGYDSLLIKKWNRTKHRTAECILHVSAEFLSGVQGNRWAQEWMLLSPVHRVRNKIADRFP